MHLPVDLQALPARKRDMGMHMAWQRLHLLSKSASEKLQKLLDAFGDGQILDAKKKTQSTDSAPTFRVLTVL